MKFCEPVPSLPSFPTVMFCSTYCDQKLGLLRDLEMRLASLTSACRIWQSNVSSSAFPVSLLFSTIATAKKGLFSGLNTLAKTDFDRIYTYNVYGFMHRKPVHRSEDWGDDQIQLKLRPVNTVQCGTIGRTCSVGYTNSCLALHSPMVNRTCE